MPQPAREPRLAGMPAPALPPPGAPVTPPPRPCAAAAPGTAARAVGAAAAAVARVRGRGAGVAARQRARRPGAAAPRADLGRAVARIAGERAHRARSAAVARAPTAAGRRACAADRRNPLRRSARGSAGHAPLLAQPDLARRREPHPGPPARTGAPAWRGRGQRAAKRGPVGAPGGDCPGRRCTGGALLAHRDAAPERVVVARAQVRRAHRQQPGRSHGLHHRRQGVARPSELAHQHGADLRRLVPRTHRARPCGAVVPQLPHRHGGGLRAADRCHHLDAAAPGARRVARRSRLAHRGGVAQRDGRLADGRPARATSKAGSCT